MAETLKTLEGLRKVRKVFQVGECWNCPGFLSACDVVFQRLENEAEIEVGKEYFGQERCPVRDCEVICDAGFGVVEVERVLLVSEYVQRRVIQDGKIPCELLDLKKGEDKKNLWLR